MERERDRERERLRRKREEREEKKMDGERKRIRRRIVESRSERADAATIDDRIYLGPMTSICQHCQALRFPNEPLTAVTMEKSACLHWKHTLHS